MEKTTLKDLADYTGLSISTVSRILRGESKSDSKNVATTIDAALKLNYPLNVNFLNSKYNFKSNYNIALVTTFYPSEFYASFFTGLKDAARLEGYNVSMHDFDPEHGDIFEYFKALITLKIDAAILFLPTLRDNEYKKLLTLVPEDFALVSVLPSLHPILDTITFDSYGGGYLVAQHFYEQGYREVGIINGPFDRNEALLRRNGFNDFITQKPDMNLVWSFNGAFNSADGELAFESYYNERRKPRAVFSTNDGMAIGFMKMATKNGLKIPEDIALSGYDDLPFCNFIHPTLTSVRTDHLALGKKAIKILKEKMGSIDHHSGMQSIIPVTLTVRESS